MEKNNHNNHNISMSMNLLEEIVISKILRNKKKRMNETACFRISYSE